MENVNPNEEKKPTELSPEIKAVLEADVENRKKLAEVFAQCWDDGEFKKKFMEHPKEVMDEFGVLYDKSKDYVILDSKPDTVTYVLPYENVRHTLDAIGKAFEETAKIGEDSRMIMPEGWSIEFIQNAADTNYIVIPTNPENLSPEELKMINGGIFFLFLFIFHSMVLVTVTTVALAVITAAAALSVGAAIQMYAVNSTHVYTSTTSYVTVTS